MRTPPLWSSCFAALLAWAVACTKANFAPLAGGAGGDGAVEETGGTTDIGDSGSAPEASAPCLPPVTQCSSNTPPATGCDPVCQAGDCGDWCGKKCTWVSDGLNLQAACVTASGPPQTKALEQCTTYSSGNLDQTDSCAPGYICLPPSLGALVPYCFQLCASYADCNGGTFCGQRPLFPSGGVSVSVCDPLGQSCATTCCDPLDSSGGGCPMAGDPPGAQYCYMVSPDLTQPESKTVCEFSSGGSQTTCTTARDCLAKTTCVAGLCRQVCSDTTLCASGAACTRGDKKYGYCLN
jgi:hypothetical protein